MNSLLEVQDLKKYFPITRGLIFKKVLGWVHAVDQINFSIHEGETFGLVGESGSGKTTTGKLVLGALQPTSGRVFFEGQDLMKMSKKQMKKSREKMAMIFQDPYSSLNPRKTAASIIAEPIQIHKKLNARDKNRRVIQLIEEVGLGSEHLTRYPHEFSGGQLQRIAIARSLALNPKLVVADEPTSALDVSVQAQILNLIQDLQKRLDLSFLMISHDLSVIKHMSDRVGIMYLGKIIELANSQELFKRPQHPYTQILMNAVPIPDPKKMRQKMKHIIKGEISSTVDPPKGCRFHPRCEYAESRCKKMEPIFQEIRKGHFVACNLY